MIKSINYLFYISIIFILTSCEGGTTFTKTIDNRSLDTITVKLFSIYGYSEYTTVNSNESKEVYWDDQMGNFAGESYNCTQEIDSIEITISNNKNLIKEIMNPDNWIRESKDGRNSREDCKFIITNEDLQ